MDKEKGLVVIVSRVTEHPNVPEKRGIYRYIKDSQRTFKNSYKNMYKIKLID